MEESPEDADLFIDKQQESEAAFWRIKKAIDDWRDNRIKRVMAQEGEGVFRTLGRGLYIFYCLIFNGFILVALPIYLGGSAGGWASCLRVLIFAVRLQYEYYKKWFEVDISQIEFENP